MKKVKIPNIPFGPFPAVLVGADVNGRPNYATVGACGVVSLKPVLYISLKNTHYTTAGVKENGFFSVNIPPVSLLQKTDYCGIVSGHSADKSNIFTPFYDELGKAPLIIECSMNILCKVIQTLPMFDFDFFLGEIVAMYINEECLTDGRPDPLKMNPLILMGASYCSLGRVAGSVFKEGRAYKSI
ncbi:flavin reductase family protein [Pelotomaculum propionicicum]|uniref:flavin reductase family protein n=1 Tax=Pelotomaculum propionicicum TaxID=258475 RepID=UPI003B7F3397